MSDSDNDPAQGLHAIERATGLEIEYTDLAFVTSHPPDIPIRNRIVAVCGISDLEDSASPGSDGWFFSDFWLFYHLLDPACTSSSKQIWLTCEKPKDMVKKYTEYVHGNPRNERRVVLDKTMLPAIEAAGNSRVVPKDLLLERFVKTVEEQARLALECKESLILLIFGHGHYGSCGVYIGGKSPMDSNSILKIEAIKQRLPRGLDVTLLMTSCFSGGWLIQPRLHQRKHLNVTGLAASGPKSETRSWPLSKSAGRACGSTIATAILNQMMEIEPNDEDDEDPCTHPTYTSLVASIYDRAVSFDPFIARQNVHFSAQNDDWESHWSRRTGVPLTHFRHRWEMLKKVPPGATKDASGKGGGDRRLGSLQNEIALRATEYLNSKPGHDSWASNTNLHGSIFAFFRGDPLLTKNQKKLESILARLVYRINSMHEVDEYVLAMGITFPSCFEFSVEDYQPSADKKILLKKAFNYLWDVNLIDIPIESELPPFRKPIHFLSIVLAETCRKEDMEKKVEEAFEFKKFRSQYLFPLVQSRAIANDKNVLAKKDAFMEAMKTLGHKIHFKKSPILPNRRRG